VVAGTVESKEESSRPIWAAVAACWPRPWAGQKRGCGERCRRRHPVPPQAGAAATMMAAAPVCSSVRTCEDLWRARVKRAVMGA
jgi:hypothetical protein